MPNTSAYEMSDQSSFFQDWFNSDQDYEHDEALNAWERSETSAQNARNFSHDEAEIARNWEKMMSDTSMQRAVADYQKAGFSPLAALQGGGASSPTVGIADTASGSSSRATGAGKSDEVRKMLSGLVTSAAKIASALILA